MLKKIDISPGLALFDERSFFEKSLLYGIEKKWINTEKLREINQSAPKGIVQIARYFGTEYLRPELDKGKDRMINLISLSLQWDSNGDLDQAAILLRDNSLLAISKKGSDLLKNLISMPQNSHFGMNQDSDFHAGKIPLLAQWSLKSWPEYQLEFAKRKNVSIVIDVAKTWAEKLGLNEDELRDEGPDAEAVIRTALLCFYMNRKSMPNWVDFEKIIVGFREKFKVNSQPKTKVGSRNNISPPFALPLDCPDDWKQTVSDTLTSLSKDWQNILDVSVPVRKLFTQKPAFIGRYFWLEDGLAEVDQFSQTVSSNWEKSTGGHTDDGSLLTLFLCLGTGAPEKTLLTEKAASGLVRKVRKHGIKSKLVDEYITHNAPSHLQEDYLELWQSFLHEALPVLESDFDYSLVDSLSLLRRECNVIA